MLILLLASAGITVPGAEEPAAPKQAPRYRSPVACAFSPNGGLLAVTDHTAATLAVLDPATAAVLREINLNGKPSGVVWTSDTMVCVAEYGAGTIAEIDATTGAVRRRFTVGPMPMGLAVAPRQALLLVTDFGLGELIVVNLESGEISGRMATTGLAVDVAVTPAGDLAVVSNLVPVGDARRPNQASAIDLIELAPLRVAQRVELPVGATNMRGTAVSPDGRWAYVVHTIGNYAMPTTQLERGWVNTNALSIIDLVDRSLYATVLLDRLTAGAADPWGLAVSPDGGTLWVSIAGTHEIARLRLGELHAALAGHAAHAVPVRVGQVMVCAEAGGLYGLDARTHKRLWQVEVASTQSRVQPALRVIRTGERLVVLAPDGQTYHPEDGKPLGPASPPYDIVHPRPGDRVQQVRTTIWQRITAQPQTRSELLTDMTALYAAGLVDYARLPASGLRGLALSPDGHSLAAAAYFTGQVLHLDPERMTIRQQTALSPQPQETDERRGERVFHDATYSAESWVSCATCHPGGRADGLNWDLLNDGIGNPKNAKSLVWSHRTPPVMWLGVRADADIATASGFKFISFQVVAPDDLEPVRAYLRSLEPEPSPYLHNGELSALARHGKTIFESQQTSCTACHPGPLFTTCRSYDVGTPRALERTLEVDTPTLIEMWRTAPYLHDGSAATLEEVVTTFNNDDRHGRTSQLTQEQINALVAYLKSL